MRQGTFPAPTTRAPRLPRRVTSSGALRAPLLGRFAITFALAAPALACNALDDTGVEQSDGMRRVVPVDARDPIVAPKSPPPLSGGTLLVSDDGQLALVADEARDRVSVVDLTNNTLRGEIQLGAGAEPGRLAEAASGEVFVVLRGLGSVARLDPENLRVLGQTEVCAEPRGLAYDSARSEVYVACMSGRFARLAPSGELLGSVTLPQDLRDVVVENGNVWVSRFRSAEVLLLGSDFSIQKRLSPPAAALQRVRFVFESPVERFEPGVAWRLQANPEGGVVAIHQRATTAEIDLQTSPTTGSTPYGGASGADCSGIQRSSITVFSADGTVSPGPDLPLSLPVDIALNDAGEAAVVGAGRPDFLAPRSATVSVSDGFSLSAPARADVGMMPGVANVLIDSPEECQFTEPYIVETQPRPEQYVVSVAAHPRLRSTFIAQMREPAELVIANRTQQPTVIPLGGDSVADTGFDLFHRNAESGLSCASCHPDGSDDGHVWQFAGQGMRRTQPVDVSLAGTAPFHWDGSLHEVKDLMGEVFVNRMGGVFQSTERLSALTDWLFELPTPSAELVADEGAVLRGRRLFESLEVGCASCHRGASFTDNNSYDVGTGAPGEKFQVPSLIGISTRSRLIHTGCASSLRERFEPECGGGDRHGKVSGLEPAQLDDLISYLETL